MISNQHLTAGVTRAAPQMAASSVFSHQSESQLSPNSHEALPSSLVGMSPAPFRLVPLYWGSECEILQAESLLQHCGFPEHKPHQFSKPSFLGVGVPGAGPENWGSHVNSCNFSVPESRGSLTSSLSLFPTIHQF